MVPGKPLRLPIVTTCLLTICASTVHAYRIYNYTGQSELFKGEICVHCYSGTIASGESAACPGDDTGCRGETWISMQTVTACAGGPKIFKYCPIQVDAHGWVEIHPGAQCVVFSADGAPKTAVVGGQTIGGVDGAGNPVRMDMPEHCNVKNDND